MEGSREDHRLLAQPFTPDPIYEVGFGICWTNASVESNLRETSDLCFTPEQSEAIASEQGILWTKKKKKKKKTKGEEAAEEPPNPFAASSPVYARAQPRAMLQPDIRALLVGSQDPGSPLSKIGTRPLHLITDTLRASHRADTEARYRPHITPAPRVVPRSELNKPGPNFYPRLFAPECYAAVVRTVRFPEPQGIHVNMMPIILGSLASVPPELRHYQPLLEACPLASSQYFKVGYLTIHEMAEPTPEAGWTHRRGGLHCEGGYEFEAEPGVQRYTGVPPDIVLWGGFSPPGDRDAGDKTFQGGLFMASNLGGSCRVWNGHVAPGTEAVGRQGDLEHLRPLLGPGFELGAGELCWLTDGTPHESLPLPAGAQRSYFRLVTSEVNVWFADHSTPNPLGVKPGGTVVHGSKFGQLGGKASGAARNGGDNGLAAGTAEETAEANAGLEKLALGEDS